MHSVQYPGPCGWTQEYGSARIANLDEREDKLSKIRAEHRDDDDRQGWRYRYYYSVRYHSKMDAWRVGRHVQYVHTMQHFTEMAQRARESAAAREGKGGAVGIAAAVNEQLLRWQDANMLGSVCEALEEVLGAGWDWRGHGIKQSWWELSGGSGSD